MKALHRIGAIVAMAHLACVAHAQEPFRDTQRENLGPAVNSPAVEILPIVSPDGATLYFDRKYDPGNVGGVGDEDDIWFSTRLADGQWAAARNVGAPLNTAGSDVLYWISADGGTALVYHGASVDGRPVGLAIARRRGATWERPVPISIDGVTSLGDAYYAYIAPDGRHMLLAYAPDTTRVRDLDIFVCTALGSDLTRWSAPRPLGEAINSPGFDGAPYLAADNKTLYFTTDGRGGMGSTDLFVARRLDTGWTVWSTPENLGGQINTPRFEASLSIPADGRHLYISGGGFMDERSFGRSDIFRIPLPEQFRPSLVVSVDGRLLAAGRGIRGLVRAERMEDLREVAATVSDDEGRFQLTLPAGAEYRLTGGADGHDEGSTTVDARTITGPRVVTVTINLGGTGPTPVEADETADDLVIHFASGSAELGSRAIAELERVLATIRRDHATSTVTRVIIAGHTDAIGDEDGNVELSRRRAEAVRDWLAAHGIDRGVMNIEGRGETSPVAPNNDSSGRARNRRVEVGFETVTAQTPAFPPPVK